MSGVALVIDVGGTRTRLALARRNGAVYRLEAPVVVPTPEGDLAGTIVQYLQQSGERRPVAAAAAVAGPVDGVGAGASAKLTNRELQVSAQTLCTASGASRGILLNDLAAAAASLPALAESDLAAVGPRRAAAAGARVVVGVGTGIGVGALLADGTVVAGEGGHCEAPLFDAVAQRLRARGARSVEDMLAGSKLDLIYSAVTGQPDPGDPDIVTTLAEQGDAGAKRTLRWHAAALGVAARDYALTFGAWGGVYLMGGLIAHRAERFDADAFLASLQDHKVFGARLRQIPAWCIVHPYPALIGLAHLALSAQP